MFEEQWQVDWLRATALLSGFRQRVNSFMTTLETKGDHPEAFLEIVIYTQDTLPNATVDVDVLSLLIQDEAKRVHIIEGRKDEFFADSPA